MTTRITAFAVPPDADAAFVAGWEAAREPATLYRALRGDVALRFVEVAPDLGPESRPGRYEVVDEDGEPDGDGGVLEFTFLEPTADDDRRRLRALLAPRQGYLGSRLHRALEPADFGLVDLVRWSSPLMFARALQQPEIAHAAAATGGHRALYLPVAAAASRLEG